MPDRPTKLLMIGLDGFMVDSPGASEGHVVAEFLT